MRRYLLCRIIPDDGALVYLASHDLTIFKTGESMQNELGDDTVELSLDEDLRLGPMPTIFTSPALIGNDHFCKTLVQICENVEICPAVIRDPVTGSENRSYKLVNIIGRIACADMKASRHKSLGPEMTIIDYLVLKYEMLPDVDIFHVHEDTDCIVVSERLQRLLIQAGFSDIGLFPLPASS